MGVVLILLGLAGFLFGLGNLVRPLGRLGVTNRWHAGMVVLGSVLMMILGSTLTSPPNEDSAEAGPSTTQAGGPQTSTTSGEPTTSTTASISTTLPTTTTSTTALSSLPEPDTIFALPTPGASGDPGAPPPPGAEPATVASITDGDTLDVVLADERVDTVRLIGTDSPESDECFASEAGLVLGILTPVRSQIGLTGDVSDRDQYGRLLRYLWMGGMSVNEETVRRGAAISRRYPPDTAMADRLEQAQVDARARELGLWAPDACGPDAGTEIVVAALEADAPGNDNENLNAEFARLRNDGELGVDMTGWVLKDESASHRYQFPAGFTLDAGVTITVFTGCGADDATSLYWCSSGAVWNNDGDTAFILDHNGNIVHSLSYLPE